MVALLCLACGGNDGVSADLNGSNNGSNTGSTADNSMMTMSGIVYGNGNTGAGCSVACSYVNPIPGAQITAGLDGTSVTTDASGKFTMITKTPASSKCIEYTITITAQGYTTYQMSAAWGNHADGRSFAMAPPLPNANQVSHC